MPETTGKKELAPIVFLPKDEENGHLSKEQFQAKMRKKRELEARMKAYEEKARAEIEEEMSGKKEEVSVENEDTQESNDVDDKPKRRGRPSKS